MKIAEVKAKIIFDSVGRETLEAEFSGGGFFSRASVPVGKSRGKHEVFYSEPGKALKKLEEIKEKILTASAEGRVENQRQFDELLILLDGAANKENLGGNLILVLSLAFARLKANSEKKELFEYIIEELRTADCELRTNNLPRPIFNVINGGAHAKNNLDFQEFQVIPQVKDFGIALGLGKEFYEKLGRLLAEKFGRENVSLGNEAGFSAPFKNNEEAIEILAELIIKYHYPLKIGLDAAASQFYQNNHYLVDGKRYSAEELKNFYLKLIETYDILSVEDPFHEEDFDSFASLATELCACPPKTSSFFCEVGRGTDPEATQRSSDATGYGTDRHEKLVITDDLTTTNPERLKTAVEKKAGNAILIKPNQIGTLTETLGVVNFAYQNKWQTVASHRSGETMDDFIADLAVGIGAWGIKAGAPAAPERMAKYERLMEISNLS